MGFPREAFRQVISDVAGGVPATWKSAPLGFQAGVRIILNVSGVNEIGWDDTKVEDDPVTGVLQVTSIKWRLARVLVRVDSFDPTRFALDIAEQIRTRLYLDSSREALKAVGVAFLGSDSLSTTDWQTDGRLCESALLVLKLNTVELDAQTDNAGGVIEHANVSDTHTP